MAPKPAKQVAKTVQAQGSTSLHLQPHPTTILTTPPVSKLPTCPTCTHFHADNITLQRDLTTLQDQLETYNLDTSRAAALESQLTTLQAAHSALESDFKRLEKQYEKEHKLLEEVVDENLDMTDELMEAKTKCYNQKVQTQTVERKLEEVKVELRQAEQQVKALEAQVEALKEAKGKLEMILGSEEAVEAFRVDGPVEEVEDIILAAAERVMAVRKQREQERIDVLSAKVTMLVLFVVVVGGCVVFA
ncbi:hypothetical protein BJ508DRAFT_325102 [Ascobolus immersus RN42]|uniref:Uncharacterized protein n=1 Tax=Ascobolus immersus RN42 TaxID=1160509 RepID=A0A3N4IA29_ASCIM|nr:hypothetical protein BJ508DRAFT_325102 [Ascobolus immersus RN42]